MRIDPESLAEEIVRRVQARPPASGRRLHAVIVRSDGDSFNVWYDIFVVRTPGGPGDATDETTEEVATVHYEHGRGERLAAETACRAAQALGVPAFVDEWSGRTPLVLSLPAPLEVPRFPALGWRELLDAVDNVHLPAGFVQQLSGLQDETWQQAEPRCRQQDLRLAMIIKEHVPLVDRRAFVVANLDGSMCVWAALALAEAGFAPLFACGPALHRGFDWSNVIGALKHVAHPLARALSRLDASAPVALITDSDAEVLRYTRAIDEDAALPPVDEAELERLDSMGDLVTPRIRERVLADWEALQRDRRRMVYPRAIEIAAHHSRVVNIVSVTTGDNAMFRYENGMYADVTEMGVTPFGLRLNPFVDPPR
jgi:hypothetical protein